MPISRENDVITQRVLYWTEANNTPNPCYGEAVCYIGPDVMYTDNSPSLNGSCYYGNCIEISKYKTASDVMQAYKEKFGIPHDATFTQSAGKESECVGLFYIPHEPAKGTLDAQKWPNSVCGILPPPEQTCDLSLPSSIDFGTLNSRELDGQTKTIVGTLKCTNEASMKLYAWSTMNNSEKVYLNDSASLWGSLNINGKDAYDGVSVAVSGDSVDNPFDFTVTLGSTGNIPAGDYSGSAVVVASFQ